MKNSLFSFFVKIYFVIIPGLFIPLFVYIHTYYSENWFVNSLTRNFWIASIAVLFPVLVVRFSPNFKKTKEVVPNKSFKYIIIFYAILFNLLGFFYAYITYQSGRTNVLDSLKFLTQKKELVSNVGSGFKIYDNEYRGFVMKYPNNWSYTNGEKNKIVKFSAPLSSTFDDFRESLLLSLAKSAINLEQLEKEVNNVIEKASLVGIKVESTEDFIVNSKTWKKIIVTGKNFQDESLIKIAYFYYVDEKNHKDYIFTYTGHDSDFEKYILQAEEIVQSFIF